MQRKTEGIYVLVEDALRNVTKPYGEDVIEDVFREIDGDPNLHRRYDELVKDLKVGVVNNWTARHTKHLTRMHSSYRVEAHRTRLIKSYTKLLPV